MRRATVTIPDDLETELDSYIKAQDAPPSLTGLVEVALRRFLQEKRLESRQYRPARRPFSITPADKGSGRRDMSVEHDRYLAEDD
jgi:metal-responsive CopG/Arc/MetJ family transcriptional regulator